MKKLVFNKDFGRGIVQKTSPSGSLVEVKFKNISEHKIMLKSELQIIN